MCPSGNRSRLVLLDTNVVAEALLTNQPEHSACLAVIERFGAEGTTVMLSRLLEIELWEVAFDLALRERHPRNPTTPCTPPRSWPAKSPTSSHVTVASPCSHRRLRRCTRHRRGSQVHVPAGVAPGTDSRLAIGA